MTIVIESCPFCGWHDVELGEIEPGRFAVDCPECECIGPFADDINAAIARWNAAHEKNLSLDRHVRHINAWQRGEDVAS